MGFFLVGLNESSMKQLWIVAQVVSHYIELVTLSQ